MLGLLSPSSPHVGAVLDLISSPDHLWSQYGVRSLSVSHPEFGQGENYWKGPIWIQMNYMILSSLFKVSVNVWHTVGHLTSAIGLCQRAWPISGQSFRDLYASKDQYHRECVQGASFYESTALDNSYIFSRTGVRKNRLYLGTV